LILYHHYLQSWKNYFENNKLAKTADEWLAAAKDIKGSWWPNYAKWLEQFGGKKIKASKSIIASLTITRVVYS
jgi:poly(3-hydroxyalkanoate) synthetase